jgi:hypothetical protein
LSSVSNVLLTIGIANVSSADEVGRFSIAVLLFLFLLAASRAVTGQVLLLRPGCGELEALALGTALLIGGLASVAGAIVAIPTGGPLSPAIAWPILFLPALLLQDTYRFIAFGRSRPGLAAAGDLAWATATGAGLLLVRFDLLGPGGLVMVWTLAGVASAALLAAATSVRPDLSGALRRPQWDRTLQLWLLAEAAVLALPPVVAPLFVGSVAGVEALGAFRLLQVLFGPVMLIFQSWYVARIGVLVRAAPDGRALRRSVLVPGAAIGALSLSLGAVLLLLPPGASKHLGGASFSQASPADLPFALATGAAGVASALVAGLRSLGRSNRVVQIRLPYAAVALAAVWLGVRTGACPARVGAWRSLR